MPIPNRDADEGSHSAVAPASFRNRAFWQAQAIWADQVSTGELPAAPGAVQRHVIAQHVAGVRFGYRGSGTVGHPVSAVAGFALVEGHAAKLA